MARRFDYFVILAEMRTGSNFLESNLNAIPGLTCYGEAFNPSFMVSEGRQELLGMTLAARDADPMRLIERMQQQTDGLPGFRLFHNHDPRVFEAALADPRCAKVILTRNLVESWVSQRIAWSTNQWWLDDAKNAKKWRVKFDPEDFEKFFYKVKHRQQAIARGLQLTGQAGFYIDYEDIQDLDVVNGLAKFLGVEHRLDAFAGKFKKQNPEMLADKVRNFDLLEETVARIDLYDLGRLPNFEPKLGPFVPSWLAGVDAALIYMPVQGGPETQVAGWLAALDGVGPEALRGGMSQKSLRQWKRQHPGHRSFSVLTHPAVRLHRAFCRHILPVDGPDSFTEIRRALREIYKVALPDDPADPGYDRRAHQAAFLGFVEFVRANLSGQTSLRTDRAWDTQTAIIRGFADFLLPDHLLREDGLAAGLAGLAGETGRASPDLAPAPEEVPHRLATIWDDKVEAAVRSAHQRDYMSFGFGPWRQ